MKYSVLLVLCLISFWSRSQTNPLTEADVQLESIFIEAIRNKLIDRHDLSIPQFREIIKKQPDNHVAWYELGLGLFKTKVYDEALDAALKALTYQPRQSQYLLLLADIYHLKQDVTNESLIYKKLQAIRPQDESIYTRWADLLISTQKNEEAIKVLTLLEQQKGINEISAFKKATLLEQAGKMKEAESELIKLNESFPSDVKYLHALAGHYVKAVKPQKANEVYKSILGINPSDERANLALAASYRQNGQDDKYLTSIQSLMGNAAVPLDVKVLELIPYLQKAIANHDQVLLATLEIHAKELVNTYPQEAKTHALYADILSSLGKRTDAYLHYKKSISLNKSIKSVWYQYLDLTAIYEEPAIQVSIHEEAFDLFPNDISFVLGYADALIRHQEYTAASSILQQTLLMTSNQKSMLERIYTLQGVIAIVEKKPELGKELLAKAKAIQPKSIMSYGIPIQHLSLTGQQLDVALDLISKAEKEFPQQAPWSGFRGIAYFKSKQYEEAKKAFQAGIDHTAYTALMLEYFGDTLFMLKDLEQAMVYWSKAMDSNPLNTRLKKKIVDKTIE